MSRRIAIFGAGGFGREVLQVVLDINAQAPGTPLWDVVGFIVDPGLVDPAGVHGLPLLPGVSWLAQHPDVEVVIAIGSSVARRRIADEIERSAGSLFASLVHPQAWVGRRVQVGPGSVVCAGCQITTDIRIERHVHVNIGSTIGHDAVLSNFVTLNPGVHVSGNVTLGEGTEVGTGSVLVPHAHVGQWSIVGAGSVVTKPLDSNITAVGAPARVVKARDSGWQEREPH